MDMDREELLELSDLNLAESYREVSRWGPHTDMAEVEDILLVSGARSFPAVNFSMRVGKTVRSSADEFMSRAKEFFAARKRGFSIIVRGHADYDLLERCKALGLYQVANSPGMAIDHLLDEVQPQQGVRVKKVGSAHEAADLVEVVCRGFATIGLPEDVSRWVFCRPEYLIAPHIYPVVAYMGDMPASCAIALLSHGIAGIYYVATIPEARGKGLASLCTVAAGNAAIRLGARCVVLQATIYGEPVYKRLGYREFTRYPWFLASSR